MAKPKVDPAQVEEIKQAGTQAQDEVLRKSTLDALLNVSMDDVVGHDTDTEVVKGGAYRAGCWNHAPAHLQLFASGDKRLTRVANQAGLAVNKVERVRAFLIKGTKILVLQAAAVSDLSAIPISRYAGQSGSWINLIGLLGEAGLTVETGYRERFEIGYVPKESPLWPGLVIDLGDSKERRQQTTPKKQRNENPVTPTEG